MHKVNPHAKLYFNIIVLCLLNIVTVIMLSSSVAKAESASSTASVTVPEACTMTSINNTPHTATLSPNTYSGASGSEYQNGIGKTTLTATCNDDNGFAIYAIGYTGNSYDSENHNKLVGQSTNVAINTAVYTSGDTTSSWSMKVNKINDSTVSYNPQNMSILDSFDSWHIVPATYTKVAQYHANTGSSTTDTSLGAKVETTYAAYIASNQPADTYIGQVKYTMVHPYDNTPKDGPIADCPANKICYSPNANDIEGTMGQQSITSSATSTTLLASNFSRKGYGFAGWSDRYDYSNDNGAKFYGPNETISFTAGQYNTTNGGLRLYAIWIPSQGSLQDQSKVISVCNSLTTAPTDGTANLNSVSALTDQRDNDTYAIAKLADGKCWMIENLRLDNTAKLTLANTNNPLNDGANVTLKHNYTNTETYNTLSPTSNIAYDADAAPEGWCTSNSSSCNNQSRLRTDNTAERATSNPSVNTSPMYSYGNYYNWYSATAGRGIYSKSSGEVEGDLCPNGWKLPLGNTSTGDINQGTDDTANKAPGFSYLDRKIGGTGMNQSTTEDSQRWRNYPINSVYSGWVSGSSLLNRGSNGSYWSSTAYSNVDAYRLHLDSSHVYPGTSNSNKYVGRAIRCIADV